MPPESRPPRCSLPAAGLADRHAALAGSWGPGRVTLASQWDGLADMPPKRPHGWPCARPSGGAGREPPAHQEWGAQGHFAPLGAGGAHRETTASSAIMAWIGNDQKRPGTQLTRAVQVRGQHHHPATGQEPLPFPGAQPGAQAQGSPPGPGAGGFPPQAAHPRALSERGGVGPRHLRGRGRRPQPLRPVGPGPGRLAGRPPGGAAAQPPAPKPLPAFSGHGPEGHPPPDRDAAPRSGQNLALGASSRSQPAAKRAAPPGRGAAQGCGVGMSGAGQGRQKSLPSHDQQAQEQGAGQKQEGARLRGAGHRQPVAVGLEGFRFCCREPAMEPATRCPGSRPRP